jgi:hypothetical protein
MSDKDEIRDASNLVSAAAVFAANSRAAFVEHYPDLENIPVKDWEFLLTVAGAGAALIAMAEHFPVERQRELTQDVVRQLQDWDESSFVELRDFLNSVTGTAKSRDDMPDVIGAWVLRSVGEVDHDPLAEHVIGLMLMRTFAGWWD